MSNDLSKVLLNEKVIDRMKKKVIVLSDGHGMLTSGKRTPFLKEIDRFIRENEFNREVVKEMKILLEANGFIVVLAAPTDADTSLIERTNLANRIKADAYVAVHYNAYDSVLRKDGPSGVETYYYPTDKEGKKLAQCIHKFLKLGTSQRDRGVKSGNLHEVREPKMPSALVECGFMDNHREALLMLDKAFIRECAVEISKGICEYFNVPFKDVETKKASSAPKTSPKTAPKVAKKAVKKAVKPTLIRVKVDALWTYNTARWADKAFTVKKDEVYTVVKKLKVSGGYMYLLKSGLYITANPQYVEVIS